MPYIVRACEDALQDNLSRKMFPYLVEPEDGLEPFNENSIIHVSEGVEPMLIVVVVGGISFAEVQELDKLVTRMRRSVMCISMNVTSTSQYVEDLYGTKSYE